MDWIKKAQDISNKVIGQAVAVEPETLSKGMKDLILKEVLKCLPVHDILSSPPVLGPPLSMPMTIPMGLNKQQADQLVAYVAWELGMQGMLPSNHINKSMKPVPPPYTVNDQYGMTPWVSPVSVLK